MYANIQQDFVSEIIGRIDYEKYYQEDKNSTLDINESNSLRLYIRPISYFGGCLRSNEFFKSKMNVWGCWETNNLQEGYVKIINPNGQTYYSEKNASSWEIFCEEIEGEGNYVSHFNQYFPDVPCPEGDYNIEWNFENVINNQNIFLNATVNYNGYWWEIINQTSEIII